MTYGAAPYGSTAYGAEWSPDTAPPGQVIPPPIPGGSTIYYYASENGEYPFSYGGYSGGRPLLVEFPGGIVVIPHQYTGVVELVGWWPGAEYLHFVRIHDDGSRHPVRGGTGARVVGAARRNAVSNPSLEAGLNGYVPGVGSPTLSQISAPGTVATVPSGQYALRATATVTGQSGVVVPTDYEPDEATVTVGATIALSDTPTAMRYQIAWTDSVGGALATTTAEFTADQIASVVDQWGRVSASVTPPTGAVTPTLRVIVDGFPTGGTIDLDALLLESGTTDGSFFDGDTLGGAWLDVADLSASSLSPTVTVIDADCPLDVPVSYLVADPALTGGTATSGMTTLESYRRYCWLTHPSHTYPILCDLRVVPTLERGIDQGVYWPIGRERAVVVSARRRAPTTEITFNALSFQERDSLLSWMADGMPMLVRAPDRYGYGPGTWWALGTVSEDREGRMAHQDAMTLTAQATEVDSPIPFASLEDGV